MAETALVARPVNQRVAVIEGELTRLAPKIAAQLPHGMSADRFQVVTLQAVAKNPDLLDCDPASVILSVLEAASVGLEPTGVLGQAYLVPYKSKDTAKPKAQLQIGYNGYRTLARRSGEVSSIEARVVYEDDRFEVHYGTDQRIVHDPSFQNDPSKITHAYCVSRLRDGTVMFDVMTRAELDGIRARSRSANRGPWVTDYPEMCRKTVIRRHVKALPMTVEAARVIATDDEAEFGNLVAAPVETRTAQVRARLAARQAQGEAPEPEADTEPVEPVEAPSEAPTACAAEPRENLMGLTLACIREPGHGGAHKSTEGSWPQ